MEGDILVEGADKVTPLDNLPNGKRRRGRPRKARPASENPMAPRQAGGIIPPGTGNGGASAVVIIPRTEADDMGVPQSSLTDKSKSPTIHQQAHSNRWWFLMRMR